MQLARARPRRGKRNHGLIPALFMGERRVSVRSKDETPCIESFRVEHWKLKEKVMLWTIAVVLIVLWAVGFLSAYTMGGFVHLLLVAAIVIVVLNLVGGRRASS